MPSSRTTYDNVATVDEQRVSKHRKNGVLAPQRSPAPNRVTVHLVSSTQGNRVTYTWYLQPRDQSAKK